MHTGREKKHTHICTHTAEKQMALLHNPPFFICPHLSFHAVSHSTKGNKLRFLVCFAALLVRWSIQLGSFPASLSLCLSFHLRHLIMVIFFSSRYIFSCFSSKQLIPLGLARWMNSLCWLARRRLLQKEVRGITKKGHYGNKTEAPD